MCLSLIGNLGTIIRHILGFREAKYRVVMCCSNIGVDQMPIDIT
jgi:hypothetical protein